MTRAVSKGGLLRVKPPKKSNRKFFGSRPTHRRLQLAYTISTKVWKTAGIAMLAMYTSYEYVATLLFAFVLSLHVMVLYYVFV